MYYLEIIKGIDTGKKHTLNPGRNVLGKSSKCDISLEGSGISRTHCTITLTGEMLEIKDAGSKNGTAVNGIRLSEERELCPGDEIQLAQTTCLRLGSDSIQQAPEAGEETLTDETSQEMQETDGGSQTLTETESGAEETLTSDSVSETVTEDAEAIGEVTSTEASEEAETFAGEDVSETHVPDVVSEEAKIPESGEEAETSAGEEDSSETHVLEGSPVRKEDRLLMEETPDESRLGTGGKFVDTETIGLESGSTGTDTGTDMTGPLQEDKDAIEVTLHRQRSLKQVVFGVLVLGILILFSVLLWNPQSGPVKAGSVKKPARLAVYNALDTKQKESFKASNSNLVSPDGKEVSNATAVVFHGEESTKEELPLFVIQYPPSSKSSASLRKIIAKDGREEREELFIRTIVDSKIELHVILSRETSADYLTQDFLDGMKAACGRLGARLYSSSPAILFFYPKDDTASNGIRYASSAYSIQRGQEKEITCYGVLYFFRDAATNYILQAEVDEVDKDRMASFLEKFSFLSFDNADFIRRNWDGGSALAKVKASDEEFAQFRQTFQRYKLERMYPQYETQLKRFMLTYYGKEDYKDKYERASELFAELRERQSKCYNRLRIHYQQMKLMNYDTSKAQQAIRKEAEQVFMLREDARYWKIRQNEWADFSEEDKEQREKDMKEANDQVKKKSKK